MRRAGVVAEPAGWLHWEAGRCPRANCRPDTEPPSHAADDTQGHPEQAHPSRTQPRSSQWATTFVCRNRGCVPRAALRALGIAHHTWTFVLPKWRVFVATRRALGRGEAQVPPLPIPSTSPRACCRGHRLAHGRAQEHKERALLNDTGAFQRSCGFAPARFFSRLPA